MEAADDTEQPQELMEYSALVEEAKDIAPKRLAAKLKLARNELKDIETEILGEMTAAKVGCFC